VHNVRKKDLTSSSSFSTVVLFVGLMVNEEALNFMPSRHYAAYVIGLFPSIYDWAVNVADKSPIQSQDTAGNINLTPFSQWFGVLAWKRGALLVSFVWVSMLVMVIDRQWKKAAICPES
jgi:AGZA family xanthine/uracil permease-like MFS transporter